MTSAAFKKIAGDRPCAFLAGFLLIYALIAPVWPQVVPSAVAASAQTLNFDSLARLATALLAGRDLQAAHPDSGLKLLRAVMDQACETDSDTADRILAARRQAYAGDIGLKLESGAQSRMDTPANNGQSAWVGIAWEILHSGWLDNHRKVRQLEARQHLQKFDSRQADLQSEESCQEMSVKAYFGSRKATLLAQREALLTPYAEAARRAYFQGRLLYDDLLKVNHELARTRQAKTELETLGRHLPDFAGGPKNPGWLALDLTALLQAIKTDPRYASAAGWEKSLIEENRAIWNEARLKLYARTGVERQPDETDGGGLTLGLRFDLPLRWSQKDTTGLASKAAEHRWRLAQQETLWQTTRRAEKIAESLKDGRAQVYREQIAAERLRRDLLRTRITPQADDALTLARSLNQWLEVRFEILATQELFYLRLANLLSRSGLDDAEAYVRPIQLGDGALRARTGRRALYQWSADFNTRSNPAILAFCRAKGVSELMISAGRQTDRTKLIDLTHQAPAQGVEIAWMGSTTEWLFPHRRADLLAFAADAFANCGRLHLDVEPQVLPDYRSRQAHYWEQYTRMLAAVAAVKPPGARLTVALPLGLNANRFAVIADLVDGITIMGYGVKRPQRLVERLAPYLSGVAMIDLTLALRPADFDSEANLEAYIDTLAEKRGLTAFALHTLADYYKLTGI
ncbi:MAG: hypothetical protein P8010_04950 [Desulfosarcinaceae bacterium]